MKRFSLVALLLLVLSFAHGTAQSTGDTTQTAPRYGLLAYDSLLRTMPEYIEVQEKLQQLRAQYDSEVAYNESDFKRQFTEFLQGQKDFPQSILLKRQRDLQDAMNKGIAFRHDADSLLAAARIDMERPVRQLLDDAIRRAGRERGYQCIVNSEVNALPYVQDALAEDAVPYVQNQLTALRRSRR